MSELMQLSSSRENIRWRLLTTVSVLTLLATVCASADVDAAEQDAGNPTVWLELGGQFERLSGRPETFAPAFFNLASPDDLAPMVDAQRPSPYSLGEEGKISFLPEGTNWVFSVALRYGRSHTARHSHHHTQLPGLGPIYIPGLYLETNLEPTDLPYGDGQTSLSESHLVLDFQAGKDVGLGMFGAHGNSTINAGVRFAQFSSSTDVTLHARPVANYNILSSPGKYRIPLASHANYTAILHAQRNTHAIGPSISWDGSVPLVGAAADTTLNLDWGANAAVLFGRQRARAHHQTNGYLYKVLPSFAKYTHSYANQPPDRDRSRFATIPNVGGFAGLSLKFPNAQVSIGYRADFFFGAMDGGIDARKSETVGFYGPFATISIGLGG